MFEANVGTERYTLTNGDAIEMSLTEPLAVVVSGYSGDRVITSDAFELSTDGTDWQPSLTIPFDDVIGVEVQIRPGSANSGTVEVTSA